MKYTLIGVCSFCVANVMAQKNDKREIKFGMELTSELQATSKGDRSATSGDACLSMNNANLLRLNASLPVSRNVSIEAATISTYMTAPESIGDDWQTFSNLDADNIPFALSVCNVAWQINDRHSLFFGIRNMNVDYFCSDVTSFFTNSSCGIYPTISANYPIANYPVASVGVHYRYEKSLSPTLSRREGTLEKKRNGVLSLQASLYNGTGNSRFTGRDNVFRVCPKSDGVFGVAEVSYTRGGSSYFLGNALYCNEGISAAPWFYTEQSITSRLTLLAGYSHAFATEAECKDFAGLGALYELGKCQLGAFTDYANFAERDEFATELTCKIPVFQYMDIQPTVHLITYDGSVQCAATLRMALHI